MLSYITLASALVAGASAQYGYGYAAASSAPAQYGGSYVASSAPAMYEPPMSSSAMMEETSTSTSTMVEVTTVAMMAESSTMMEMTTPCTTTAAPVYSATVMAASAAMTHSVVVGGSAGLVYTPTYVLANVGDIIEFTFMSQNHSVTQSTFLTPCIKMAGGLDSGLTPNPNNTVIPAPTFQFTVNSTAPTWWYCKQKTGAHCGKGMTFAVNPTMEKTYAEFMSMAIAQNGTTSTTAAAAGYTAAAATGSPVTLQPATTSVAVAASTGGMVVGSSSGSGSTCQCECFCGVGQYPMGAGVLAYGGMGGSLPAPWASSPAPAAASYIAPSAAAYSSAAPMASSAGSYGGY